MYTRLTDSDFKYVFEKVPRLCVDFIVESEDGFLLSLRDINPGKGMWHIPGGTVGKNEPLSEAVKRIAKKETGLTVEIVKQLGVVEYPHESQGEWERHTVSIVFVVRAKSGGLVHDNQSKKLMYVREIPSLMYPGQAEFLRTQNLLR